MLYYNTYSITYVFAVAGRRFRGSLRRRFGSPGARQMDRYTS